MARHPPVAETRTKHMKTVIRSGILWGFGHTCLYKYTGLAVQPMIKQPSFPVIVKIGIFLSRTTIVRATEVSPPVCMDKVCEYSRLASRQDRVTSSAAENAGRMARWTTDRLRGSTPNVLFYSLRPHAYQDHMPTKTTCLPRPHAYQDHMPTKTTCLPRPHAYQDLMPTKTTCLPSPHAYQDHMPTKTSSLPSPHAYKDLMPTKSTCLPRPHAY